MTSPTINHVALGKSRVALQYQSSPKFLAYITKLLEVTQELETVYQKIPLQLDIDIAEGVNLDIIGEIVGISRIVDKSLALLFLGFENQPGALSFGEEGNPGIGGRFRNENEPEAVTSVLADPEYRTLLKAKIVKNHAKGTNEDILAGLAFLFGSNTSNVLIVVEDFGAMAIQIAIGRQLTYLEKILITELDILPRPAGVRISYRSTFGSQGTFGFQGHAQAKSFGEEGSPLIGGTLAEEF